MDFSKVGIVDDPLCELHIQNATHPECPDRVKVIRDELIRSGIYNQLFAIPAREATFRELAKVHFPAYIKHVFEKCKTGGFISDDPDMYVSSETGQDSLKSALVAAGGVIEGVNSIINGDCDYVFCNVRPPGHHAHVAKGGGFCMFNNVAVGVRHALTSEIVQKALIFDLDVHDGDGTENVFKYPEDSDDKSVLFISTHRAAPFYPNAGFVENNNDQILNIPLPGLITVDEYRNIFKSNVLMRSIEFKPDIIFISCGLDSHKDDILGGDFPLTEEDYVWMIKKFKKLGVPIVLVLEGGYNLTVLGNSVREIIKELGREN